MKKFSILYLLIGLGVLLVLTQKLLLPFVYDVAKSDAFLEETKNLPSQYPISDEMTNLAFMHCNNHIKTELGSEASVTFSSKPINSWTLGNYHYLINGEISIAGAATPGMQKYVCRIAYDKSDNLEAAQDYTNWTIEGIDGVEGL